MPSTKTALKRMKTAAKRTARNREVKSRVKTAIRHFEEACREGDPELVKERFVHATKHLDKAAAKGVIHKNKAARKKSQLARKFNQIAG